MIPFVSLQALPVSEARDPLLQIAKPLNQRNGIRERQRRGIARDDERIGREIRHVIRRNGRVLLRWIARLRIVVEHERMMPPLCDH